MSALVEVLNGDIEYAQQDSVQANGRRVRDKLKHRSERRYLRTLDKVRVLVRDASMFASVCNDNERNAFPGRTLFFTLSDLFQGLLFRTRNHLSQGPRLGCSCVKKTSKRPDRAVRVRANVAFLDS